MITPPIFNFLNSVTYENRMNTSQTTIESGSAMAAKLAPPTAVSAATLMGYSVPDLMMWATLVYTTLLIIHKLYSMGMDVYNNHFKKDMRVGLPDTREVRCERRKSND